MGRIASHPAGNTHSCVNHLQLADDTLSPFLFILASDCLGRIVANGANLGQIASHPLRNSQLLVISKVFLLLHILVFQCEEIQNLRSFGS